MVVVAHGQRQEETGDGERAREILLLLAKAYPDARCSLDFGSPLQLLIATILSAQCTDERVNAVTPTLFHRYPDAAAYVAAPREELEAAIRPTGFYRNKAASIQGACRQIVERFDGQVPRTMEELLTLPGVARKTANVVLSNAFGQAEGIAVDTHVARLSGRLGLTAQKAPERIEHDLMERVPRQSWAAFNHHLIYHGRAVCKAQRPRCAICVLADLCPAAVIG